MELITERRILHSDALNMSLNTAPPHFDGPKRPHKHDANEIICIIKGTGKLHDGGEALSVKPGDVVKFEPWEEHYIETGDDEVILFEVCWK